MMYPNKSITSLFQVPFAKTMYPTKAFRPFPSQVPFAKTMYPTGSVENWLSEVERKMKESVREQAKLALEDYQTKPRSQWVQCWPAMVVLAGSSIYWTRQVEEAISKGTLADYFENVQVSIGV
jgi:dynein heavy chain